MKPIGSIVAGVCTSLKHRLATVGMLAYVTLLTIPAFGTSVILVVTSDNIVIGADSAALHTNERGEKTGITQRCKVLKEGSVSYALSGEYTTPAIHFDMFAIAKRSIAEGGSIKSIVSSVEAKTPIAAIAKHARSSWPDGYVEWIKGVPVISMVLAYVENGRPTAVVVEFKIDPRGIPIKPEERTLVSSGSQAQIVEFGNHKEMDRILDSSPAPFMKLDTIQRVRFLIQAEIDASAKEQKNEVGPPISILNISAISSEFVPGDEGVCGGT